MRSPLLALLWPLTVAFACARSRPLPLTDLDGVTRIEVRSRIGTDSAHVITHPARIANAVAAVRAMESGWEHSPITLPAGDVSAVFFRDTMVVGVLWLGRNYLIAAGREGPLIRSTDAVELARVWEAFDIPVKVIPVPPRGTT